MIVSSIFVNDIYSDRMSVKKVRFHLAILANFIVVASSAVYAQNIDSDKIIQLWQAANTSHKPSLLYRVRMVCYANTDRVTSLPSL